MDEKEKKIIKTTIFGTTYTLRTDSTEEYVKKITDMINLRMSAISSKNPGLPSFKIAVLSLIEMVDEMLKTKEQLQEIENELSSKTADLIKKIEDRLSSDFTME